MRILHLTLKKQWFSMIASGEKKEEYRQIKPYWIKRLGYLEGYNKEDKPVYKFTNHFDSILFRNGYSKDAPEMLVELKNIVVKTGLHEWGAEGNEVYFVLQLGNILSISNYTK